MAVLKKKISDKAQVQTIMNELQEKFICHVGVVNNEIIIHAIEKECPQIIEFMRRY